MEIRVALSAFSCMQVIVGRLRCDSSVGSRRIIRQAVVLMLLACSLLLRSILLQPEPMSDSGCKALGQTNCVFVSDCP